MSVKASGAVKKLHYGMIAALSFAVPCAVMLLVFRNLGFYPFGAKSLLITDMNEIYVQFFESLRQIVSGQSSIFFSWNSAMGSNFIGDFAYYLASPLSFITLLFNSDNIQLAIFYLTLIKISLCGLTAFLYLRHTFKFKGFAVLIFSTSYALMSYNIIYALSPMWIDGIILLPIVLWGIEKILQKEKPYLFILSFALMIYSNFYIAYMIGIFAVMFIGYRYLTSDGAVSFKGLLKTCGKTVGYAVWSAGLSLWLLLPVLLAMINGKAAGGFTSFSLHKLTNFKPEQFLQPFLRGHFTSITYSGLPAVYVGLTVYIMCIGFFIVNWVSLGKKLLTLSFFVFLLGSFYITWIDLIWHWFQTPAWFPYRYQFVFSFLLVFVAFCFFVGLMDRLKAKETKPRKILIPAVCAVLLLVVCVDMYGNSAALFTGLDNQAHYKDVNIHADFRDQNLPLIQDIQKNDSSFYRMEKTYRNSLNDPLGLNYRGMTHYSSMFSLNFNRLIKQLGFAQDWYWSSYNGSTPVTDSLFDFKYILSKEEMPSCYPRLTTNGDITVYENPYALPVGFMADINAAAGSDFGSANRFKNQNSLLSTICGEETNCFILADNIDRSDYEMRYTFTAKYDLPVYISFAADNGPGGSLFVNGNYITPYFTQDNNRVVYIGQFAPGTPVEVFFNADQNALQLRSESIYYLDTNKLAEVTDKLKSGGLYHISYGSASLKGEVNAAKAGVMFTSIPYDKGFTVRIDGKKTDYTAFNGTFLMFDVSQGHHTIAISFVPNGFVIGLAVSVISLLLLILYILYQRKRESHTRHFK